MRKKPIILLLLISTFSCWSSFQNPAVDTDYDFYNVGKLRIDHVKDFMNKPSSGKMVMNSIAHNFLRYGYLVSELDKNDTEVKIKKNGKVLDLSCIITEYTDSEMIIVPYHYEDRGYVETKVEQSLESKKNTPDSISSQSQTSTTTTHGGKVNQGKRVEYSQTRVGIMLKMVDQESGNLVWSNSYSYTGLEMQRTVDYCVRSSVLQIRKLFRY
tara:strand:+ start:441 stop:1079 length:639 start_codon:yes stop_codon:yes gene_type:complete